MTVPGVGPLTALRFVAALDDVTRFESAHQVESYLGLVPGENSSSDRQQRLSITKAGPRALRWVLVQAAWALHTRCRKPEAIPLQLWSHRIEQRRGKRTAIIALARKLAGILYALWRDGSVYDGGRGARVNLRSDRHAALERSEGTDRQLSRDGDRALNGEGYTTSYCRLRPVDGHSLCADSSANTRMRQLVDLAAQRHARTSSRRSCAGTDPILRGQPLHTRSAAGGRGSEAGNSERR